MRITNSKERRNEINSTERYELFKEALSHCGKFLLNLADEDIEYHIFEEFDGDCTSFLNKYNLNLLRQSGKITMEIVDMALELASKFRALEGTELWNMRSIRKDEKWLEIIDSLEYLDKEHKTLFKGYCASYRPDKVDEYLERFLAYLLYRHATEAIDIDDFSSRLSFCLFCERLFASLIYIDDAKSLNEIAKLATIISEEIEYSSDNTLALRESNPFGLK